MTETTALRRTLSGVDLTLITIGAVIGSGIFLVPGVVLRQTDGWVGVALLVWTGGGILSLLGALTYAELGAMKPVAGGLYAYIRDAFGPLPAFLFGWSSFLVISSGTLATLAVAFSGYIGQIVPLGSHGAPVVSVLLIAVLAVVNIRGTKGSAVLQNWTTGAKVLGLVVLALALIQRGGRLVPLAGAWPSSFTPHLAAGIGAAMLGVLWAYEGWQDVTFSAGEARDPQRAFAPAIAIGTMALIAIYLLANVGYVAALGPDAAARSDHVATDAVRAHLNPAAGQAVGALILMSIFSSANTALLTRPRMYFAMARDGVFFERLAEVHPRFGTPAFAIGATAVWSAVLAASGTFEQLLTYVVFAGWIFYGLGAASVFIYRRREPGAHRPYEVPGYPITPALFVLSAIALIVNTLFAQPARAAAGLAIVLAGVPVFFVWRSRRRRPLTVPPTA